MFNRKIDVKITAEMQYKILGWSNTFTPDIARLEQYQNQLLFVCDDWMSDRVNSLVLKHEDDYVRCATGFTSPYRFYNYEGYGQHIPVVLDGLHNSRRIKGEVVSLRPHSFLKLDRLRLNGIQFRRRRVNIIIPYRDDIVFENTTEERRPDRTYGMVDWRTGKFPDGHPLAGKKHWHGPEKVSILQAWMYFGYWKYWSWYFRSNIASFHEVPRYQPKAEKIWLNEYYKFQDKG